LALGLEVGAARAVPALVGALVDVPIVVNALHDLGDLRLVPGIGGADEEIVRRLDPLRELLELRRVAIGELLRRHALALGRELDATRGSARPSTWTYVRRPSPRSPGSSGTRANIRSARTSLP